MDINDYKLAIVTIHGPNDNLIMTIRSLDSDHIVLWGDFYIIQSYSNDAITKKCK